MPNQNPEQLARDEIDKQLLTCGWIVQNKNEINLGAGVGKDYQQKTKSLDFVMLFIPVEGAYITAMQNDIDMWRKAYNKRVVIMSPTNLIPAMKLVYDLWKKEDINKDAQIIADKAVKIYEKLAAFVEDFEKVGTQTQKAASTFNDAEKKLYTGKGNY